MNPEEATAWLAAHATRTAVLSDFDGTLSTIVADPSGATPLEGAVAAMKALSDRLAVVAVVSGRPASFLVERFGLGPSIRLEAYGLHGLEHVALGETTVDPGAASFLSALRRARDTARAAAPAGVEGEDKGFGVTIHWRRAEDPAAAAREMGLLASELAREGGLAVRPGKASTELYPPLGIDKGSVVVSVAERLIAGRAAPAAPEGSSRPGGRGGGRRGGRRGGRGGPAPIDVPGSGAGRMAFFGDDSGDLAAFSKLDSLASSARLEVLKVAVGREEAPPEIVSSADLILDGPSATVALLGEVVRRLGG